MAQEPKAMRWTGPLGRRSHSDSPCVDGIRKHNNATRKQGFGSMVSSLGSVSSAENETGCGSSTMSTPQVGQDEEVDPGHPQEEKDHCRGEKDEKFDIVIASCGGHPKDIYLYQAQRGLNLASQALKPGGHILLLAASSQGVGDDIYFDYVAQFTNPEEVLRDFKKSGFQMDAHKAYLFGRTLIDVDVAISSDLDPGVLRKCLLRAADPTVIINEWVEAFSSTPRIAVVPNANTTYFYQIRPFYK